MSMVETLSKTIVGKIVGVASLVIGVIAIIWYWNLDPATKEAMWDGIKAVLIFLAVAAVLPWATFFLSVFTVHAESNKVAVLLLIGYFVLDVAVAMILIGGFPSTGMRWLGWGALVMLASGYNFTIADYIAERMELK